MPKLLVHAETPPLEYAEDTKRSPSHAANELADLYALDAVDMADFAMTIRLTQMFSQT
jgi:hypothetical protein